MKAGSQVLTNEIRRYIVQALACFDTPSQIVADVKTEFGIVVTPQSVNTYNPTLRAGENLAKKWVDEFHEARAKFKENIQDIPIANKAYRLRQLDKMFKGAGGNKVLASSVLEQAAKEVGEAYTNKREITGKDGEAIQQVITTVDKTTVKAIMADIANDY